MLDRILILRVFPSRLVFHRNLDFPSMHHCLSSADWSGCHGLFYHRSVLSPRFLFSLFSLLEKADIIRFWCEASELYVMTVWKLLECCAFVVNHGRRLPSYLGLHFHIHALPQTSFHHLNWPCPIQFIRKCGHDSQYEIRICNLAEGIELHQMHYLGDAISVFLKTLVSPFPIL